MTFENRGRPTEPPENKTNMTNSDTDAVTAGAASTPEELIAYFPVAKLRSLVGKISNQRWIVPVLPEQELECLLNYAIELTKAGVDHECEPCMQFYREGLSVSFMKILTDEAVNSWKYNIHYCILNSCGKLLQLCALHMKRDNPYLLDLLFVVLDPENKFNTFNVSRHSDQYTVAPGSTAAPHWGTLDENQIYAKSPPEPRNPRGWLCDLINRFGEYGGFDNLLERFNSGIASLKKADDLPSLSTLSLTDESTNKMKTSQTSLGTNSSTSSSVSNSDNKITVQLIHLLLRPFGQCYELLTVPTIEKYFMPIWEVVLGLMDGMSDEELKREAKPEGRSDSINGIVKAARSLASRLPNQENLIKDLEMFRLKMILRLLKVSSFNGKMNALNEINKMLSLVSYYPQLDEELDWLTAERMATWIKDTDVLGIVLRDSLHQPQYVEKLEKIIRFLIKEQALSLDDLDAVWRAQDGKHETIVKNVHDLLAKLAWDFNAEQLDHLFKCFEASMSTASKRPRERLLELIRRLAEDDKNGVMATKVLNLFWQLGHSPDISQDVMDQALSAHVKILDYSCSKDKDAQKYLWLDKCVEEVKTGETWVLPALRLIREICCLYEATPNHLPRLQNLNRLQVIERVQSDHSLVILVTNSLITYLERVRRHVVARQWLKPNEVVLDGRYPHPQQIQERLDFLKFLLKDGQLWLCADQAKLIWECLAVNAVFPTDREECFRWFGKLMGDDPDLDPGINRNFFEENCLKLDPHLITESGIKCFERFFKAVNSKEGKLKEKHRGYILDDENLIGKDYLWNMIVQSAEEISHKAIELLIEVSTALGERLQTKITDFHDNFIVDCFERLEIYYESIVTLNKTITGPLAATDPNFRMRENHAQKMCRVIRVLQEYIKECDRTFNGERKRLPLSRAHRGKDLILFIRFNNPGRQIDDMEFTTHTNEMVTTLKKNLLKKIKGTSMSNIKVDFFYNNGELIDTGDDRSPIGQFTFRDKTVLTAKLTIMGTGLSSSPDSSSDSSTGSPPRPCPDVQRPETEWTLPGVIISQKSSNIDFILKIYQLASDIQDGNLRDSCCNLLHLVPADYWTSDQISSMCGPIPFIDKNGQIITPTKESMFLNAKPTRVLYNLEVLHSLLLPAVDPIQSFNFQLNWIKSGIWHFILELLTKKDFLPDADMHVKRAIYQNILRLVKIFLYIVGCVLSRVGDEPTSSSNWDNGRSQIEILKSTLTSVLGNSEVTVRAIAKKLAENLATEMLSAEPEGDACRTLFGTALNWNCPDFLTIKAIVQLAWASGTGCLNKINSCNDFSGVKAKPELADQSLCKEALEVLTISLVLNPEANESLCQYNIWPKFITSIVLMNPMRQIRQHAGEQLYLICTFCAGGHRQFDFVIKLLVESLQTLVPNHASTCADFFQLLCRNLNYGCLYNWPLAINDQLLGQEIAWLRSVKDVVKSTGETQIHEDLLEGHLSLTKELMFYLAPELKSQLTELIVEIVDDFLFPASQQYLHLRRTGTLLNNNGPPQVCRTPHTTAAACELLAALCQGSVPNMKLIVSILVDMFCTDTEPLREWEYLPPILPRPYKGFCGLKNAGATCYMNSVLQQLFMVPTIRYGLLSASGATTDPNEDFSGECDSTTDVMNEDFTNRNRYHIGILKHVQAIFAHLGHSALQFYVPRGLWSHFKLQGEPVNLREQQDAVEFFMSLFESLDEGLKALGHPQLMGATLGGSFSDQKICQECPHRYSKEEPFSVFSVDIRNHSSLTESLEQYVKGELLEGADAYHCDKCDKKVVTVKRLCVQKLPPVLAIQLKRFEYDYERVCAIKFNDYFEFPRMLDMEPYTVSGLAKMENKMFELEDHIDGSEETTTTKYQLTGIVVHSGQASGGHYFSYILHRDPLTGKEQWCKFDDGEVTECKMHEDDEMKAQCFGGDYMGEVYDNNLKRMQLRRQKRWWNAYMLFYTRCDEVKVPVIASIEQLSLAESRNCVLPMPGPIEKSVRSQNLRFLHSRNLFSAEFFNFIRKLVSCCLPSNLTGVEKWSPQAEELSLLGIQLGSQFLFHSGFHTKKTLRGPAIDWYEALKIHMPAWFEALNSHIRNSAAVRRWFAQNVLLNPPTRLSEYILLAPSQEVRMVFVKLVTVCCLFAGNDEPISGYDGDNLCEQILKCALALLKNDVAEHGKHLGQYFTLFSLYAATGPAQKQQLLKLNVPALFMQASLGEDPSALIKGSYSELGKLHQVVSVLVRSSDVSSRCQSSTPMGTVLPNAFLEPHVQPDSLIPLSKEASELLFNRTSYIKRLIEDPSAGDDGVKLLQYCSWENPHFSRSVLTELLWHCGFTYFQDMRRHTELLLNILLVEDSWQNHRIHNALMGVADERAGLLETIQKVKQHYEKRAYQIIKCLVQLFRESRVAATMLNTNQNIARHWTLAVEWLQDELDRKRGVTGQYNYSSWSPPAPTNDNLAYMLLRSQSAENTLQMAAELCPEEEQDEQADSDVEQLEDYPSTEQVTAVISSQNDDSQPDQSSSERSTIDSELLTLIRNDATPSSVTEKSSEPENVSDKTVRGKSRTSSSQNVISSSTSDKLQVTTSYTLPEPLAEQEENKKTKPAAATMDVLVNAINGGLSNLKLSPGQLQPPASLSISVSPLADALNESKGEQTASMGQSSNETNVSQSSPILSDTISPSSSQWHYKITKQTKTNTDTPTHTEKVNESN